MSYTVTAPSRPEPDANFVREAHELSAGDGSETSLTITARFLRRISRALASGLEVLSKVIDNTVSPPTVAFQFAGPRAIMAGGDLTIATTGNTDEYVICDRGGTLVAAEFSGTDALAAHDTNYITFSITNLGQAGAGTTALLAATDANTTKATGGSAIAANTKRSLTKHGTAANLVVVAGDRLRIRAAVTGTLANTVTGAGYLLRFAGPTEGYIELLGN